MDTRYGHRRQIEPLSETTPRRDVCKPTGPTVDSRAIDMRSPVIKRSIVVGGHKTSVSLEEAFWNGMKEISGQRNMTLSELVGEIDHGREQGNLSSAIRLFVLDYFRSRALDLKPQPQ